MHTFLSLKYNKCAVKLGQNLTTTMKMHQLLGDFIPRINFMPLYWGNALYQTVLTMYNHVMQCTAFCHLIRLQQWLNSAGTGRNGVPPPVSGVPPPEFAVPPPKVVVPPHGNDVPSPFGGKSLKLLPPEVRF